MNNTEDRLRRALHHEAGQADTFAGTAFEDVRHQARAIRRRRRTAVVVVAAAAVAAITVPTAVLLQGDPESARLPADRSTQLPTPTPTAAPTTAPSATPSTGPSPTSGATPHGTLESIPRGAGTFLTYVGADGVVHADGTTSRLPGTTDVSTQFLSYRGGWLVVGADNVLRQYDGSGRAVASGRFGGIAVTADRTYGAWLMGDRLYQGALSTMGEGGPQSTRVPASSGLVGFLPQGPALVTGGNAITIAKGDGSMQQVPVPLLPTSTSQAADLVGGLTGTVAQGDLGGAVYDLTSHTQLWQNSWRPARFSDDGTLVAAIPAADNGDASTVAILDARTGKVIARTPKLSGIHLGFSLAWDQHRVIIPSVSGPNDRAALLALDTSGTVTRVTEVERSAKPGGAYLILDAQP
jgi:hypothetical protein